MTKSSTLNSSHINQQFGIGLENEGYFLNTSGEAIPRINGKPSSEYVITEIENRFPQLRKYLSVELPSVILEIKSDIALCAEAAIDQILEIRQLVNTVLPENIKLVFAPFCEKEYEFIASTSDPTARAHSLIQEWGKSSEGRNLLYASSICSMQINDSRPFKSVLTEIESNETSPATPPNIVQKEMLEIARKIHNLFSHNFADLCTYNSSKNDFRGKTRMESYFELMSGVKSRQFQARGYTDSEIVVPPFFADIEALKKWMCAHSDVSTFAETSCKNDHAATVKIKRDSFWASETRVFDSVDSKKAMLDRIQKNSSLLASINKNPEINC